MLTPWQRAKLRAYNANRYTCEICGWDRATDAHHSLVHRDKRFPVVDNYANLMMVCHTCHMEGKAEDKQRAVEIAIKYNGIEAVLAWLNECAAEGKIVDEQIRLVKGQ